MISGLFARRFVCAKCGKAFRYKSQLVTHYCLEKP